MLKLSDLFLLNGMMLGFLQLFDKIHERCGGEVLNVFVLQQLVLQIRRRRHSSGQKEVSRTIDRDFGFGRILRWFCRTCF